MYETSNDLPPTTRRSAIELLNEQLADAIDLQLQAKQAHWNINFAGLHALFDQVAAQAREYSDEIAERAVALGGVARGTVQAVSGRSQLREYPVEVGDWRAHVGAMQDALATFGRGARKAIDDATALNDADTADLFTEISRRCGQVPLDGRSARAGRPSGSETGRRSVRFARSIPIMIIPSWA